MKGSGNVIRLRVQDAERYIALRREMLADSPWAFASSVEEDRGCNPVLLRESLALEENAIFVVEEDGARSRLVASAGLVRDVKAKRRHVALIWGVYATPTVRGKGFGRAVVQAAIDAARGWPGVEVVQLCVSAGAAPSGEEVRSPARLLYESLGFVAWGTEPDAMRVGGRSYAETHMSMALR